jgi:hypothetical protein
MQNALKDIFDPMFEAMLKGKFNTHLGYESNEHQEKVVPIVEMVTLQRH